MDRETNEGKTICPLLWGHKQTYFVQFKVDGEKKAYFVQFKVDGEKKAVNNDNFISGLEVRV
jgi:hypothetical protein